MDQGTARQQAIAAGHSAADVDAFIAKEGGDKASAQRITSAFGVSGSTGTDNLDVFHAQKAAAPTGGYHSGQTSVDTGAGGGGGTGGGGGGTPGGAIPDTPAGGASDALAGLSGLGGSLSDAMTQSSAGQPSEVGGSGLRTSLGSRLYPANSAALAGLQRAY